MEGDSGSSFTTREHISFPDIEGYLRHQNYPCQIPSKGEKVNFRRTCRRFSIQNGQLYYKENRLVITDEDSQRDIIHDVHQGSGENAHAKAMVSHLGRTSTYAMISARFYWYSIVKDVVEFVRICDQCQKQNCLPSNLKNELHSIPVPRGVMKQIGVDLCTLTSIAIWWLVL